ncbi:ATP-dependent DNA ligase [Streptosporangium subroseum]|uniref:ATP-dependent DNA ligase n=1 Tax=Streptosporangium subroseum TaxID=106412 RepID=UPI00342169C4
MRVRGLVEPMLARAVDHLPTGPGGRYIFEPKWDGFRAVALVGDRGEVELRSRRGARLDPGFPEVAQAVGAFLPPGTVIIRWAEGRLDFEALQRRIIAGRRAADLARSEPCHYVVFDVPAARGRDLRSLPLRRRRGVLEELFADVPRTATLVLSMMTTDPGEAQRWFGSLTAVGVEGIMVKPADGLYRPGYRGWGKYKARHTIEAIVGGVTGTLARPAELLLGRYSTSGRPRLIGGVCRPSGTQTDRRAGGPRRGVRR